MATLYITEPGATLHKEYKRLRVVDKNKKPLMRVPISRVSEVVIVGWAGVTTPAMLSLLDDGIGLTMLTRDGKLRGRLTPPTGKNVPLRRLQYKKADDPEFCLRLSRAFVEGKLRNSRSLAYRMLRTRVNDPTNSIETIKDMLKQANHAVDISTLMGYEGRGAKAYFRILRAALKDHLEFGVRSRRPPKDHVNALLSLGYSLLTANMMTALEIVGLDPYCGFFHTQVYGRPALALDLMEEFRPIIVDSVVLTMVNKRMLTKNDFEANKDGIYLSQSGKRIFFREYSDRLNSSIIHPLVKQTLSYQKIFELQARQVAKLIQGQTNNYHPFVVR
jgi:CRISPR-associated protein Cas1